MGEVIDKHEEETGHRFCLEAHPSNGASYRLAEIDRKKYPDIITSGVEAPFYTNSTCLPVDYTDDLWDALEHQKKLHVLQRGHRCSTFILGRDIRPGGVWNLASRVLERSSVPCFAFSPSIIAPMLVQRGTRGSVLIIGRSRVGAGRKRRCVYADPTP
jgi:ribonucleoside-triphosphate reductase